MAADDDKADLARQGLSLVERAENVSPDALAQKVKDAAATAAGNAVLGGMAALNELTGGKKPARTAPSPEAVDRAHAKLDAAIDGEYDERLARAASRFVRARAAAEAIVSREAETVAGRRARLRRSFPAESKELATLVFSCVDLFEEVARGEPPPPAELAKAEALLGRIAKLLRPHAGDALESFVHHTVSLAKREPREDR
jgi:hypothetical protein